MLAGGGTCSLNIRADATTFGHPAVNRRTTACRIERINWGETTFSLHPSPPPPAPCVAALSWWRARTARRGGHTAPSALGRCPHHACRLVFSFLPPPSPPLRAEQRTGQRGRRGRAPAAAAFQRGGACWPLCPIAAGSKRRTGSCLSAELPSSCGCQCPYRRRGVVATFARAHRPPPFIPVGRRSRSRYFSWCVPVGSARAAARPLHGGRVLWLCVP